MEFVKKYYAWLTSLFVFIIYLFTIAPSVIQIDSGELAAVQALPGIAHPTGYPLFTILGYVFLSIPLPVTKIFQANLLATVWCSLGVAFFIKSAKLILDEIKLSYSRPKTKKGKNKKPKKSPVDRTNLSLDENEKIVASIFGGLVLAFGKTYWFQSTSVEVYSLHIFLVILIIHSLLKAYYSSGNLKAWLTIAIVLALGFSNHMTTILIIPGIAYLFFKKEKFRLISLKKISYMLLVFFPLLGLLYSYLPFRAFQNPLLNWVNPINFENFFRHFSGKQYSSWLFSSFDSAQKQFSYFVSNLPFEFALVSLIIAVVGINIFVKLSKPIFYFFSISLITTVLYSINYDIVDIDSYFLLAYISLSFFAVFGFLFIIQWALKKKIKKEFVLAGCGIIILFQLVYNFDKVDQSDVYTFEDYTKELINSTEENSIIFSYQWDYFLSASYYYQYVEGFRNDVVIIDKELLRRSWYYNQMQRNYPDVIKNLDKEITGFLKALKPFEQGGNFNPNILEKYFREIMTGLVSENIDKRNFYIGPEVVTNEMQKGEFNLPDGYSIVPHLFLFKVVKDNNYQPAPLPNYKIRFPQNGNKYTQFIEQICATMLQNRAIYEIQNGYKEKAKSYVDKIRSDFPSFQINSRLLNMLSGIN